MIAQKLILLAGIVLYFFAHCSSALHRRWMPNTNIDNPNNWNLNRRPCSEDTVLLPESMGTSFLSGLDLPVTDLYLPKDGVLVLSDGASISAPAQSSHDDTCDSGNIRFVATEPSDWLDPENWCEADAVGDCQDNAPPRLDIEMLPCIHDELIFPTGSGFLVKLNSSVTVATLTLRGEVFRAGQWSTYDSKEFQFSDNGEVHLTGHGCDDPTGCSCGNDEILQRICGLREACQKPACKKSLRPVGHCCDICGAIFKLEYNKNFKYKNLEDNLRKQVPQNNKTQVIISKTPDKSIQVVVMDSQTGEDATEVAKAMHKYIMADVNKLKPDKELFIKTVQVLWSKSQSSIFGSLTSTPEGRAKLAGIIIAIGLILGVAFVLLFIFLRRYHSRAQLFGMHFFHSQSHESDSIQMTEAHSIPSHDILSDDLPTSFGNPMFDEQPVDLPEELKTAENNNQLNQTGPAEAMPSDQAKSGKKNRKRKKKNDKTTKLEIPDQDEAPNTEEIIGDTPEDLGIVEMVCGGPDGDIESFSNPLFGAEMPDGENEINPSNTVFLNPTYDQQGNPDSDV